MRGKSLVLLAALCFALLGCQPKDYYLKQRQTREHLVPLEIPGAEAGLDAKLAFYNKNKMKKAGGGCILFKEQCLFWHNDDVLKWLDAEGFKETAAKLRNEEKTTAASFTGGLASVATLSYILASPFQNARDNTLWRDIALVSLPVAFVFSFANVPGSSFVYAYNKELMEKLDLDRIQVPQDY